MICQADNNKYQINLMTEILVSIYLKKEKNNIDFEFKQDILK